jgi:lysophospholipase L1-like esterase
MRSAIIAMTAMVLATAAAAALPCRGGEGAGEKGGEVKAGDQPQAWIAAMKEVHARFKGEKGSFAVFGDSISDTMAFWAPLMYGAPQNMDEATRKDFELVAGYSKKDQWGRKGGQWGNASGQTVAWAHKNMDDWLRKMNPEVAVFMFGTNDISNVKLDDYEARLRETIKKLLDNGTVVILSTIPPRAGMEDRAKEFSERIRKVAGELKVPLEDFHAEILKRRPDDWNGKLEKFQPRKGYEVLTLISGDGVHPSNPKEHIKDFSETGLKNSGLTLRNYLALRDYAAVVREVFEAGK